MSESQRDVQSELKALRLNGMASAWTDLMEQDGGSTIQSSRWLIEHLLQAEDVDRHVRSIAHQMKAARFPIHRDLAGFDFEVSPVDKVLIKRLASLGFTDDAQNVVLIGGLVPGGLDGRTLCKRLEGCLGVVSTFRWSHRLASQIN
jgi:DNA replication protein DnaC